jgi:hypothetical protein
MTDDSQPKTGEQLEVKLEHTTRNILSMHMGPLRSASQLAFKPPTDYNPSTAQV